MARREKKILRYSQNTGISIDVRERAYSMLHTQLK